MVIESIELLLFKIGSECRTIDRTINHYDTLNAIHEALDYKVDDALKEVPEKHEKFLNEVRNKLEELTDIINEYTSENNISCSLKNHIIYDSDRLHALKRI